jgi:HD-like signal output (HDOD) protein
MLDKKTIEREVQDFVKASELPVMPILWERINKITSDSKSSARDLAEAVLQDQVLTGKVISVANTPFWGIGQKVTTITKAVLVLGFTAIRNVVFMVSIADGMMKHFSGPAFNRIWVHSIGCGVAARLLAIRLKTDPEQAMIAGLLHDCGSLFLLYRYAEEFKAAKLRARENWNSLDVEREMFGLTHEEVGGMLARAWGLPDIFVAVCKGHHAIRSGGELFLFERKIIHLANSISWHVLSASEMKLEDRKKNLTILLRFASQEFSISSQEIKDISAELTKHVEEISRSLDMDLKVGIPKPEEVKKQTPKQIDPAVSAQKITRQIAMLHEISSLAVDKSVDFDSLLQAVIEGIYRGIGFDRVFLMVKTNTGRSMVGKMGLGHDAPTLYHKIRINLAATKPGLLATVADTGKSFNVLEAGSPLYDSLPDLEVSDLLKVDAYAALPMTRGAETIGCILLDNTASSQVITDADLVSVETLLNLVNMALINR